MDATGDCCHTNINIIKQQQEKKIKIRPPRRVRPDTTIPTSRQASNNNNNNIRKRRLLILGSQTILFFLLVLFEIEMYTNINYISTILPPTTTSMMYSSSTAPMKNYVFGYGSLICPESRNRTNPNLVGSQNNIAAAMPVIIQDLERIWSAHLKSGWTAVGVNFMKGEQTNGVLVEIPTSKELNDLDRREAGYDRKLIKLKNIQKIPYLPHAYDNYPTHPVLLAKQQQQQKQKQQQQQQKQQTSLTNSNTNNEIMEMDMDNIMVVKVWVYVQKKKQYADPSYPIPQSYVDIVMRGCLTVGGKKFAKSFIQTTKGWHGSSSRSKKMKNRRKKTIIIDDDDDYDEDDDDDYYYCWIDDRNDPIYRRSDRKYSNDNKHLIDQILNESIPTAFENRVEKIMHASER